MLRLIVSLSLVYTISSRVIKNMDPSMWSLSEELDKTELSSPPELSFTKDSMEARTIDAGSELELMCEVTGIPTPIIMWQLNGKLVDGQYETTVYEKLRNVAKPTIQHGITASRLKIPCANSQHQGQYKCIATNGRTTIEKTAQISVVGTSTCEVAPQAPFIQLWSDSRFENEGNSVQLICRSQKNAVIAWYNQDKELLNNHPGYEVFPNGDLLIKNAKWDEHMGTYTCVASNDYGEDRAEIFFYPTALPEETEPKL